MSASFRTYGILGLAILLEVTGTTFLQKSAQMTKLAPSVIMGACYAASFYCLSQALRTIPVGIAYAVWSGLGIVLVSAVGHFVFKQKLDAIGLFGLALIIAGVVTVNAFSKTAAH